jgi:GH15 family glucan-1,4-alpha-glucosidase
MQTKNDNVRYLPIEDYGIVGNLKTVALVSLYGSVDYMCFPRFDSPSVFCRLLDADKGGCFSITPQMAGAVTKQLYMPDTNILVTRFFADEGIAEIIDYMPINEDNTLVRRVSTIRGKVGYRLRCAPRFNYASAHHSIQQKENNFLFVAEGDIQSLRLQSEVALTVKEGDVVGEFFLAEDEVASFVLGTDDEAPKNEEIKKFVSRTYRSTLDFWQNWIAQSTYNGHWGDMVRRSALTLKLLISQQYGSMVAAPTFSLPEAIGGGRNWDYRFTWIRDAAFAMHAFLQLGFFEEAQNFLSWVQEQSTSKELQLMFAIDGNTELTETCLDYLEGYKDSKPVRIGNAAHRQTQMDIYGELLETVYIFVKHGGDVTYEYWKIIQQYIAVVISNWQKPDHSIWEVRGQKREFLFSRMMNWTAMDRAIKIGDHFSYPYDFVQWRKVRNEIYEDLHENFWSEEKGSFVQSKGSQNLDASALLMPIFNIISPHSEKCIRMVEAIDKELRSDILVYRYREESEEVDGLKEEEGTFTMCSFWFVESLALCGQIERAKENFEKMLGYANHLGLYAEQLGRKGEHLGNFPQAFTHLALISAAIEISESSRKSTAQMRTINKEMK